MQGFCPLASGSSGNCVFFGTVGAKILIDAGISCKRIEERLSSINVDVKDIDAVLITHEHMDHIAGLKVLCSRYDIPLIANAETARSICRIFNTRFRFKIFTSNEPFVFQNFKIHPFSIQHDAADPVGFIIYANKWKLGYCADLGFASTLVLKHLEDCDYLYLEFNHVVNMVHASNRPEGNKQRILGRQGHLSNEAAANALKTVCRSNLKRVYLAHLSAECNHPDLASQCATAALGDGVEIVIARRREASLPVFFE